MTSPSSISLLDNDFLLTPVHEQQQESSDGEEDTIHDSESEARLKHRARLIEVDREGTRRAGTTRAHVDAELTVGADTRTILLGDAAELVYAGYEGSDEAEIDKGDEDGGFAGRLPTVESGNRPGGSKNRDDEEGQDVSWCKLVCFRKAMDEPS